MQENCCWCDQQSPHLQAPEITALNRSNGRAEIDADFVTLCKKCERDLKEYEYAWELLSR